MKRWKLTIEYDGTPYSGWQVQDNAPSVQVEVETAIKKFCQQDIHVHVAGRTDAGVHACGQVVHFDLDYGDRNLEGYDLAKAINAHLRPSPIAVLNAEVVEPDFHARFDAKNKLYTYRIVCRLARPVLDENRVWFCKRALDAKAMHEAAQVLLGHHDFSTFRDAQCQAKTPMRTLDRLDVEERSYDGYGGKEILIHAEGQSFLHHQVRTITGTLALVGEGKWTKADVKAALEACDRTKGGPNAPPHGLYLMRVDY